MSKRYEVKTTKEIKQALKKEFNWKFSVRQGKGTAHHWVGISWIDGPSEPEVRSFCNQFNDDGDDDHMTDLWCGSQYTSTSREVTAEHTIKAIHEVCKERGIDVPEIKVSRSWTDKFDVANIVDYNLMVDGEFLGSLVHRKLHRMDLR